MSDQPTPTSRFSAWAASSDRNLAIAKGFIWAGFVMFVIGSIWLAWAKLGLSS